MDGATILKDAATAWNAILKDIPAKIKSGNAQASLYTKKEGIEGDLVIYVCTIISGDYAFRIECFYPPGNNPLELRRLIITKKGSRGSSFLARLFGNCFSVVAKFDIIDIICAGHKIALLGDLPTTCEEIYNLVKRASTDKNTVDVFEPALSEAQKAQLCS